MRGWGPRRLAWPNKLHRKSLLLFGSGLGLQCIILLATAPGTAQEIDPRAPSLCLSNCPEISVASAANIFVSDAFTTTYTINLDTSGAIDPFTDTVRIGTLLGDAEFVKVEPNQGLIIGESSFTYTWVVTDPVSPLVITTTVQPTVQGTLTQTLARRFTDTIVAEVETSTLASESPPPFIVRYNVPVIVPVGVITETYSIAPGNDAITITNVLGGISSLVGRYRSVVGSDPGSCNSTDLSFNCTVLFDTGLLQPGITITFEVEEPAQFVRGLQVSGGGASLPLSFTSLTHPIQTDIDIKPGGSPNTIRIGRPHNIAVAILSSADFHAAEHVDVPTLAFGPTGQEASPTSCAPEYSNADTLLDLVCHFDGMTAGFRLGDKVGTLSGRTLPSASFASGLPIAGQDSVRIIDPGKGKGPG